MIPNHDRRWASIRRAPGDYLQLGNDDQTWYRIRRYNEDGDAIQGNDATGWKTIRGTFWMIDRRDADPYPVAETLGDLRLDTDDWTNIAAVIPTRREAIQRALDDSDRILRNRKD